MEKVGKGQRLCIVQMPNSQLGGEHTDRERYRKGMLIFVGDLYNA